MAKDMKEGLSSSRKADLTHVRTPFLVYTARPCEYGSVKYERANFLRAAAEVPGAAPLAADFVRFRSYLRAAWSHIGQVLDAMERHQANDPNLTDEEGMRRAAYAVDTDTTPGAKVGASMLPHVSPACASLMMAVTQAAYSGLLPEDPGTPWQSAPVPERVTFIPTEPAPLFRTGPAEPLPVAHGDKCIPGQHTHSWNVPLADRKEEP